MRTYRREQIAGCYDDTILHERPAPRRHLSRDVTMQTGAVVAGRYRLTSFVGSGASADVFAATEMVRGTQVALKVIRVRSSAYGIGEVWREAQLARRVRHRNVCRVLDVGAELVFDGGARGRSFPFLVLELLAGETLRERVQRKGPLPLDFAIQVAKQIAAGLSAIHRAHIIHRDMKSANVLLASGQHGERAVIIDFGLALCRDGDGSHAAPEAPNAIAARLCGTPAYMAPEQAIGLSAKRESDVYALGTVLYEMLTGRLPYPADSSRSILYRKQAGSAFPAPSALRRGLPVALERIICRCLAVCPSDRYRNATEVHRALTDAWRNHSGDTRSETKPAGAPPLTRRSRRMLAR